LTLPAEAVKEMLRIGIDPVAIQLEERAVTFHYPSGAWLRTQLFSTEWPDLGKVLDRDHNATAFPDGFFEAARRLDAFTDKGDRLYLRGGTLATSDQEGVGAMVDLDDFGGIGCHFLSQMVKLEGVATSIDFTQWPGPCLFFGEVVRGAIIGLRMNDAV
jgi:hypothetical protein